MCLRERRLLFHLEHGVQLLLGETALGFTGRNADLVHDGTAQPVPAALSPAALLGKQCLSAHLRETSLFPALCGTQLSCWGQTQSQQGRGMCTASCCPRLAHQALHLSPTAWIGFTARCELIGSVHHTSRAPALSPMQQTPANPAGTRRKSKTLSAPLLPPLHEQHREKGNAEWGLLPVHNTLSLFHGHSLPLLHMSPLCKMLSFHN